MVKLTPELIVNSYQRMNPVHDRELDLRGFKIPMIENLGATLNQFDTIDFSDNDIRKIDNFPLLPRLKNILMNNNRVVRISPDLYEVIPELETIVLTNNMIQELGEIDNLVNLKYLRHLSFLFNPVSTKENYRMYVIYRLPQLKVLDFRKIREKEREEAKAFFKTKKGKEIRKEIASTRTADVEIDMDEEEENGITNGVGVKPKTVVRRGQLLSAERSSEVNTAIKEAIKNATSLEEIERLNQLLRSGQIPQAATTPKEVLVQGTTEIEEVEEEESMETEME